METNRNERVGEKMQAICIDLKSFYASVECVERGLDPMTTKLVVADPDRTEKTICLAITPAMKVLGIKNRCRLYEIPKDVEYIIAPPRMQLYMEYTAEIYAIYLKYIAKEDIHVYSIDEAFMDVTEYLSLYHMTARELGSRIMEAIYTTVGIRATCGIGTNLYLAKIALDILAKNADDFIGELDEATFQQKLWEHTPLTDFWRIGPGTMNKLRKYGILTMKDIAAADEGLLYKLFGIDAELLIDHAWGREPVTIKDIKAYRPETHSLTSGQVLPRNYSPEEAELIVKEMTELLCLELVKNNQITKSITLHIGYAYEYEKKAAHGTVSLKEDTNNSRVIVKAILELYQQIIEPFPVRRINISMNKLQKEEFHQFSLFEEEKEDKRKKLDLAVLDIKTRFGKNAILKGMNLLEGATTRERNEQIGGHRRGVE